MKQPSFSARLVAFLAFALPMAYLGTILAVATHEIIGHGLGAIAAGGTLNGFMLRPDGFGYALLEMPVTVGKAWKIFYLLSGISATILIGAALALVAWIARSRFFLSLGCLILAANLLLDGSSYLFWNAYSPLPPGDIGQVCEILSSAAFRPIFLLLGGAIMLASIIGVNIAFWRMAERYTGNGTPLFGWRRCIIFLVLSLAQAASWFVFDWNLIAPGLGMLPNIIATASTVPVLAYMGLRPAPIRGGCVEDSAILSLVLSWICFIVVVVLTTTCFQPGVHFKQKQDIETKRGNSINFYLRGLESRL